MTTTTIETSHNNLFWYQQECCSVMAGLVSDEVVVLDPFDYSLSLKINGGFLIPLKACPNCASMVRKQR